MQKVEQASSPAALLDLARQAIVEADPGGRELVRQAVARHGRHWDRRLAEYLSGLPTPEEIAASPLLFMGGSLDAAVSCVKHMDGIHGFTTGMAEQHRRRRMKELIDAHRLSAVSWMGRATFAIALEREAPTADSRGRVPVNPPNTRPRVAMARLLEFPDIPTGWLRALRAVYADDAWMVERIGRRL